jgi:hypothetical protein
MIYESTHSWKAAKVWVVCQFEIQVSNSDESISRKGAKAQREDAKKAFKIKSPATLCELSLRLCAFAGNFFSFSF